MYRLSWASEAKNQIPHLSRRRRATLLSLDLCSCFLVQNLNRRRHSRLRRPGRHRRGTRRRRPKGWKHRGDRVASATVKRYRCMCLCGAWPCSRRRLWPRHRKRRPSPSRRRRPRSDLHRPHVSRVFGSSDRFVYPSRTVDTRLECLAADLARQLARAGLFIELDRDRVLVVAEQALERCRQGFALRMLSVALS